MATAIDTAVLADLWNGTPEGVLAAQNSPERASSQGPPVIAPVDYGELVASPPRNLETVGALLQAERIEIDWDLGEAAGRTAALACRGYVKRRHVHERGAGPRRSRADFIVGAHAIHFANALLTFDRELYRAAFPALTIIVPGVGG